MSVTTILQIFKRPNYLKEQLEAVLNQSVKSDKIIVVHNEGDIKIEYPDNVQLIYANPNMKFHLRFAIGLLTDTEYVSFLDDDTIPQSRWYENCIETIRRHDCLCVTNGRIYVPPDKWAAPGWGNPIDNEMLVDFGGHAWFLRQENLKYMWYDKVYEFKNGEDIMLSANLQVYGNIPTYVPPHPPSDLTMWGSHPEKAKKFGSDAVAHWLTQPTHFKERFDLVEKYAEKGWKLINK